MASKAQRQKGWLLPEQLTGHPTICVQFEIPDSPEYRAATRGAIMELTRRWNWQWEGKGDYNPRDVAQIFRELIDDTLQFNDECGQHDENSGCIDYPLDHPIIEWNPNDPFRTPDLVPGGYAYPPWYKANSITGITLGTSLGDIVTDITRTQSIPVIPPASGYPRLRIHLKGEGKLQLRLVQLNAGGYAQITTDDDILSVEIIALNKDVISIPPESSDDLIIEREIHGTGNHHVDVLFIPRVNDELLPPVTQGGAVRGITLCGFDEMVEDCPDCPDPDPCPECEDCEDCEDFIEDEIGFDLEELEMLLDCYKHSVGDIKMHALPTGAGGGWLHCDGTMYSKTQYPELYALLTGSTTEDADNFAVPDFTGRSPMQPITSEAFTLAALGTAGELAHTLTESEMPAHDHGFGAHTHEVGAHKHTIPEHGHSSQPHTHALPAVTIDTKLNSVAGGSASRVMAAQNATGTNGSIDFVAGTSNSQTVTVDNRLPFDTENSAPFQTGSASGSSAETGGGEAHSILHPVVGVHFFIFAGCVLSGEDCQ